MKRPIGLVLALCGALVPASGLAQATFGSDGTVATAATDGRGHEEIVVDFDDAASARVMADDARAAGIELRPNSVLAPIDHVMRAWVPAGRAATIAARLRAMPGVEAADPNFQMHATFVPNDPQLADQWGMSRVGAPTAWNFSCGRGVTVAVIDTGVAYENHGDFTRVLDLAGTRFVPGYNFVAGNDHPNDDHGHGTHVAGTIAQTTNNGFGVAGVAYCASIMPVKVLAANGSGTLANVAEGIRFAADHGAQVINLSLGGGPRSSVMGKAVAYARSRGAVVVCAAGNSGRRVESPANEAGAFAVSAIDPADQIAYFSSRGPEIQVGAPGVNVLQHTICNNGRERCEQFAAWSGTSMAAPHVAGVAALVVAMGVSDPAAVERVLRETAEVPSHGQRDRELYGAGLVSAAGAVAHVHTRNAVARVLALALVLLAVAWHIRARKGVLARARSWVPTAVISSVGLAFIPWLLPRVYPGVDLLMRPVADWSVLLGMSWHRWLPLANIGVVLALVGVGFGRRGWRAPIGGFALGTAAYLLAGLATGFAPAPLGGVLRVVWLLGNAFGCLWVARIALDDKTAAG